MVAARHSSKPRYLIWSLHHVFADGSGRAAAAGRTVVDSRLGKGALKLGLEITLPLARGLGLGEVVRYSIVRA